MSYGNILTSTSQLLRMQQGKEHERKTFPWYLVTIFEPIRPLVNRHMIYFFFSLFMAVKQLRYINQMYEYEFDWFVKVFKLSIENSNKSKIIEKRLRYLKVNFRYKCDIKNKIGILFHNNVQHVYLITTMNFLSTRIILPIACLVKWATHYGKKID